MNQLDENLRKEFHQKIEEFLSKKLKDQNLEDVNKSDIKVLEELKFTSDRLNELSDQCKLHYTNQFIFYCQYLWGMFSFITKSQLANKSLALYSTYSRNRHQIPLMLKNKLIKKVLERMESDDSSVSIHVNRKRAQEFFDSGKVDEKGEYTVFA